MESTESQCRELDSCFLKCYMHIFDGVQQDIKLNKVYQVHKIFFFSPVSSYINIFCFLAVFG